MRYVFLIVFALLGIILQSTLFSYIALAGVSPDLTLLLALFFSIFNDPQKGAAFGFILGLAEDIILGRFIGMNALSKGLTAGLVGWFAQRVFSENLLVPIMALFFGTIFNEFIFFLAGKLIGLNWSFLLLIWRALPVALLNTCLVPFVYPRFYKWTTEGRKD